MPKSMATSFSHALRRSTRRCALVVAEHQPAIGGNAQLDNHELRLSSVEKEAAEAATCAP